MKPHPTPDHSRLTEIEADLKSGLHQHAPAQRAIRDLLAALKHMTEWKDNAYGTIREMIDAAYTPSWSGGKTQCEAIGRIKQLEDYHSEMCDLDGPVHQTQLKLQAAQTRLRSTRKALRALVAVVCEIDCSYGRAQKEAIQQRVDWAMDDAVVVLYSRSRRSR